MNDLYAVSPEGRRYRLGNAVRRGGEGMVYEAWADVRGTEQNYAIKVARPTVDLARLRAEWAEQMHLLRRLRHSSVMVVDEVFLAPPPYRLGENPPEGQRLYMVMNWAEGASLSAWVPAHPERGYNDVAKILNAVAAAVAYIHSGEDTGGVAIIHRDLSPANVIIDETGRVWVVDFGLARAGHEPGDTRRTPGYGAPEARRGVVSQAADMFSVGALAYFMFVGEHPPELENEHDRAGEEAVRRGLRGCPLLAAQPRLVDHIMSALAANPARRVNDVGAWAARLDVVTSSRPVDPRRLPPPAPHRMPAPSRPSYAPIVVFALVIGLLGGGAYAVNWYRSRDRGSPTESASGPSGQPELTTTTASTSTTTTMPPTTTTTRPAPVFLYDRTSKLTLSGDVRRSEADINGTTYPRSFVYTCDLFCNDGPKGTASFVMDRTFKQFHATVGSLAGLGKGHSPVFEVFVDATRKASVQVPYGTVQDINVDVTQALQLDLVITDGHVDTSPAGLALVGVGLTDGSSSPLPASAWGDPVLTP